MFYFTRNHGLSLHFVTTEILVECKNSISAVSAVKVILQQLSKYALEPDLSRSNSTLN